MSDLTKVKNEMDQELSEKITEQTSGQFGIAVKYIDETVYLNKQEFNDIKDIASNNDNILINDGDGMEYDYELSMNFNDNLDDYTDNIKVLFAMHRYIEAWTQIDEKIDKINYKELSDFRHFRLKRDEYKVFNYIHDKSIIGDDDYARLLVLSGNMNNMDFWKEYFAANNVNSVCDILDVVRKSFGEVNPMDVGLVEFKDEFKDYFMDKLTGSDKLDEYLVNKACVLFSPDDLKYFIQNDNFDNTNYALYVIAQYFDEYTTDEDYAEYFNMVLDYSNDISQYYIDNEKIFIAAVNSINKIDSNNSIKYTKMLFNSDIMPGYINTIKNSLREFDDNGSMKASFPVLYGILFNNEAITDDVLSDLCLRNVYKYALHNMNTTHYVWIPSVKFAGYAVYNTDSGNLMYADKVYDYREFRNQIRIFDEFEDDPDYKYHEISDTEKSYLDACKSEDEYKEFMYAMCEFFSYIDFLRD